MKQYNSEKVTKGVEQILDGMGIAWKDDENFKETPHRVARAFYELSLSLYEPFNSLKTFPSQYEGIVLLPKIEAIGLCPHHLLPIEYQVSFAYMPQKTVLGLSKIPRIIKYLCAQPILQEDLTKTIVNYFKKVLSPQGIAVVVRGIHGCMKYRGVGEADVVQTAELDGYFLTNSASRAEFYSMIHKD